MEDFKREKVIHDHLKGIFNLSPLTETTHFAKTPCDCCGDTLAGERLNIVGMAGRKHTADKVELSCCVDCFGWLFT